MSVSERNAQLLEDFFSIVERFWSKVAFADGNACWLWTGYLGEHGYGIFHAVEGNAIGAHRFAYILSRGPIPIGLVLLHGCDNPPCVRPDHLRPGTQQANVDDMWAKNRGPSGDRNGARLHPNRIARGERRWNAKLDEAKVIEMRERTAAGASIGEIGAAFGVRNSVVSRVVTGQTWTHVGGPIRPVRAAGDKLVNHTGDKHWTRRKRDAQRGEANPNAKVTAEQVVQIRERVAAGERQATVATAFGVSPGTVQAIAAGRIWAFAGGPICAGGGRGGAVSSGEDNANSRLTVEQVVAIRERHAAGESQGALGSEFGMSRAAVSQIVTGKTWADVGGPVREPQGGKLDEAQVREIRRRLDAGESGVALAKEYGVSTTTITNVRHGKFGVYAAVAAEDA